MKTMFIVALLILSNTFMFLAWYGHLYWKQTYSWFAAIDWRFMILISWGIALLEYCFQVPANYFGYKHNGGNFDLMDLKVIQETISIVTFPLLAMMVFRNFEMRWNHWVGFAFLVAALLFMFWNQLSFIPEKYK